MNIGCSSLVSLLHTLFRSFLKVSVVSSAIFFLMFFLIIKFLSSLQSQEGHSGIDNMENVIVDDKNDEHTKMKEETC